MVEHRLVPGNRRWPTRSALLVAIALVATLASGGSVTAAPPPPSPPPVVRVIAITPNQVVVEWNESSGKVNGYRVRRNGKVLATVGATVTSYTDTTGVPGTSYDYSVAAIGAGGAASESHNSKVKTPTPPDRPDRFPPTTPDDVEAVALTAGRVLIVWQYSHDETDVSAYVVLRNGKQIAVTDSGTFRYIDTKPGSRNATYQVQAIDSTGKRSRLSAPADIQTLSGPLPDVSEASAPDASAPGTGGRSSALAAAAYSPLLRRYPYLTDVVNSNDGTLGYATVNWATDRSATTATMKWGAVASDGSCTPTNSVTATRTGLQVNAVNLYQWKASAVVLPATQYCYRVYLGSSQVDLLGGDPSPRFRTLPAAGSAGPISFAVFGDWGSTDSVAANPDQAALMRQIADSDVSFAVTTGDNAYSSGSQNNYGDLVEVGPQLSAVFGPNMWTVAGSRVPLYPAMGNHGFLRSDTVHPHLGLWPQDRAVATSSGRYQRDNYCCLLGTSSLDVPSTWYAFDAGPARIYVIHAAWADTQGGVNNDPYQVDAAYHFDPASAEYQWLQQDLAAHPGQVKMVAFHYPLVSDQKHENSDAFLQSPNSLSDLLHQYGVKIAFNGHAHIYQRNLADSGGMVSYVTGGGGALVQSVGENPCNPLDAYAIGWSNSSSSGNSCGAAANPSSASQVYHWLKVTVTGSQITVTPMNALGQTFDVQTYNLGATVDTQAPSVPTGVAAVANSTSQVTLTWTASTDNVGVSAYDVRRDGVVVSSVDSPTTTFVDNTVSAGITYNYDVRARDAAGNATAYSSPAVAVTTPTPPPAGTLVITPVADTYVDSTQASTNYGSAVDLFSDTSPAVQRSYLRFDVAGVAGAVTSATVRLYVTDSTTNAPALASTAASWAESTLTWANQPASGATLSNVGDAPKATWIEYPVTSAVTGNGSYAFVLLPESSNGLGVSSREAVAAQRPQLVITTGAPVVPDTQPPSVPGSVLATAGSGTVTVTWTASTDDIGVTGYDILRGGSVIGTVGGAATSHIDATVAPATSYTYQVRARDAAGNMSAASPSSTVTTLASTGPITFVATEDTYTDSGSPSSNYGSRTTLLMDTSPTTIRSYLRFAVTGITGPPASAVVRLYVVDPTSNAPALATISMPSAWESTLTWANQPTPGTVLSNVAAAATGTWISYPVTAVVTGNGTYDFVLLPESSNGLDVVSREGAAANRPQLVVTPA